MPPPDDLGLPRVLTRGVVSEIAEIVSRRHRAEGVDLLCGIKIAGIEELPGEFLITLAGGHVIAADLLVIGIGVAPNTGLAAAAGLAIENGIAVDSYLRTSDPYLGGRRLLFLPARSLRRPARAS